MSQATFRHGNPLMVDHTPSGADVTAGDVVVVGELVLIAHNKIEDGKLGALGAGRGVYRCTADGALSAGAKVYRDAAAGKITATSTSNKHFGNIAPASSVSADGDAVDVIHTPNG